MRKQDVHQEDRIEKERGGGEKIILRSLNDTIMKKTAAENHKGGIEWLQRRIRQHIGRKI
jgi:hypothetical protein